MASKRRNMFHKNKTQETTENEERNEDIRDVIERVTEKLVGGSLDHVRVGRLTTHPAYLPPSKEETPKHVHFQLKGLVKEIIHEANSLPLFKIIEKFQIYPKRPVKHITDYDKTVYSESENSDSDSECSIETGDGFSVSTDPLSMTFDGHMHENQRCDDEIIDEVSNFGFYHKYKLEFPKLGKQHAEVFDKDVIPCSHPDPPISCPIIYSVYPVFLFPNILVHQSPHTYSIDTGELSRCQARSNPEGWSMSVSLTVPSRKTRLASTNSKGFIGIGESIRDGQTLDPGPLVPA
ncbi:hypothetical protein AAG570_013326 [Ranatra chinensis]|uniref:Uncharacterized protein n=1 Tax=Ranatra chinensis TaxID=642074 RepID=A0ABD0Z2P8_9HEMI